MKHATQMMYVASGQARANHWRPRVSTAPLGALGDPRSPARVVWGNALLGRFQDVVAFWGSKAISESFREAQGLPGAVDQEGFQHPVSTHCAMTSKGLRDFKSSRNSGSRDLRDCRGPTDPQTEAIKGFHGLTDGWCCRVAPLVVHTGSRE